MQSLGHQLAQQAERDGDREAIVATGGAQRRSVTYAQLHDRATRLAHWVEHEAGLQREDRVALLLANDRACEFFTAMAAGYTGGFVPTPMNARLAPPELVYQLTHSGSKVLVTSAEHSGLVAQVADELPDLRLVLVAGDGDADWPVRAVPLTEACAHAGITQPRCGPHDLADLLYTSGTTGNPKGALFTHAGCEEIGRLWVETIGYGPGETIMLASPPYTSTGSHSFPLPALRVGATMAFEERFDPPLWCENVARERPEWYMGVPAMLTLIVNHLEREPQPDLRPPAALLYGGSSMPEPVLRRVMDAFPDTDLWQLYGLTESGPTGTALRPADQVRKLGSIGQALVHTEMRIVDDDGNALGPGEEGEIAMRSGGHMREYLDNPEATAKTIGADGWLFTGDVGTVDEEGFFTILDRKNDMIIRGGFNIYPAEVEAALVAHPGVEEAGVAGVPHDVLGQAVAAFVVLRAGAQVDADELKAFCAGRISDYKAPREVHFIDVLPRNAMGKILRRELLASLA